MEHKGVYQTRNIYDGVCLYVGFCCGLLTETIRPVLLLVDIYQRRFEWSVSPFKSTFEYSILPVGMDFKNIPYRDNSVANLLINSFGILFASLYYKIRIEVSHTTS